MLKNIIKAIVFISVCLFSLVKLSYVLRTDFTYDFTNTIRGYLAEPADTIDVLYVGSSAVNRIWLPMEAYNQYGFTSYNITSARLPQQLTVYLIKDALKYQSPALLIVDLRIFVGYEGIQTRDHHIRGVTDVMYYSRNRTDAVNNSLAPHTDASAYHIDILKYHANFENLFVAKNWNYAFKRTGYDETKTWGGYDYYNIYYAINNPSSEYRNDHEIKLLDDVNKVYIELIDYLLSLDIDVIFTVTPFEEREGEYGRLMYLSRIAGEYGIPFISCNDYFDEIGLESDVDFQDEIHANILGAELYTKWFGEYLVSEYNLPDRRGDPAFSDWDRAYQLWSQELIIMKQNLLEIMPEDAASKALSRMH